MVSYSKYLSWWAGDGTTVDGLRPDDEGPAGCQNCISCAFFEQRLQSVIFTFQGHIFSSGVALDESGKSGVAVSSQTLEAKATCHPDLVVLVEALLSSDPRRNKVVKMIESIKDIYSD